MGKKEKQARPQITDVSAVAANGNVSTPVVSESSIEVADLICEGEIEGIVSGNYQYYGILGETGFRTVTTPEEDSFFSGPSNSFDNSNLYTATGIGGTNRTDLGFLRSIYWNEVPVVDQDGYYNFNQVDINYTKGTPEGDIPRLNSNMGSSASEVLDLSVHRNIGERLYGPDIKGGDQAPTTFRHASLKDGTRIDKNAKTYNILNRECSSVIVNVKVNSLQEHIRNGPKTYRSSNELNKYGSAAVGYGDVKARSVVYYIYYQPIFDERFNSATDSSKNSNTNSSTTSKDRSAKWYGPIKEVVTGKIDQGYIRSTKIDLEDAGEFRDQDGFDGWRVRIVRTTPEPLTSFFRAITFVDSVVEIYGTKLRYPYSSMLYSRFDAANFNRVPSRAYDTKLQKIKIPNNYDPIKRTYGKSDEKTTNGGASNNYATDPENFWDGEFHTEKYWSDNPAWCFYDILTNERYGLGEYVNETEVDKWALYEIAQYCDQLVADGYGGLEPRFTLNHLVTNRGEAYKLINDLASAFRGLAYFANGLIFTVQDSFKKPIYQLNNSNVLDGDFSYSSSSKKARHTVAIVRYIDKKNFFQPAIEYVSDEEGIKKYGIRQVETSAIGCTSRGQARRFGLWILASESNETETVNFKMGPDGSYLKPGDIVQIFDNNVSSLKYSGRTNAVSGLAFAATPPADEGGPASRFSSAYDSVILDSALNFSDDKIYTFSLLTPTFNYDASVSDLNSSGIKEIRRSHLQTLHFRGDCVRTRTGEFKSNFELGGSGVCTQIFFKTGAPFDATYFNNADFGTPTGNRLDFDNYVITGYVNTGVNIDANANTKVEYSGGYYNGEGLVWSIEPYDEDIDGEFSKGSFSNYRLINIKEDTDQTYGVSALQYFSGKYDDVENKIAFDNPFLDKNPQTPKGLQITRKDPTENNIELKDFELLNIKFDKVGYVGDEKFNEGIDYLVSIKTGQNYTITPPVFNDAGVNIEAGRNLGYEITTVGDFNFMGATGYTTYHKPYRQAVVNPKDENVQSEQNENQIELNFFISEQADYYVSVFAISPYGVMSEKGIVGELSSSEIEGAQSLINRTNISALTTVGISTVAGGTPGQKPGNTSFKSVPANNPVFTWQVGADTTFDQKGVYVTNQDLNYRITIREPKKSYANEAPGAGANIPSPNIYFEFTGQNATVFNTPEFNFTTEFNSPNLYTVLDNAIAAGSPDVSLVEGKAGTSYYRVDETGMLVKKGLSLPLREFDVVVEAHDANGRTSVGRGESQNRVFYNTIFKKQNGNQLEFPGENFAKPENAFYYGYDILGISIDPIPPIVFPNHSNLIEEQVTSSRAYQLGYPYVAELNTLPNGHLELDLNEAQDPSTNQVIKTQDQIDSVFENAAGVVFYYTTGSEDLEATYESDAARERNSPTYKASYRAKKFTIDPEKIPNSIGARFFGMAETSVPGGPYSTVLSEPEDNKEEFKDQFMSGVFRDFRVLEPGQTVPDLMVKFQKSKEPGVENAHICVGVFDQLSYLAHFNEDGKEKTQTVNYFHNGQAATQEVPTIFIDKSVNYSTIPLYTDKKMAEEGNATEALKFKGNTFTPTSFFVQEKGIITARDKDLTYKAWFDIEFTELYSTGGNYPEDSNGVVVKYAAGPGRFVPRKKRNNSGEPAVDTVGWVGGRAKGFPYALRAVHGADTDLTPDDTFKMPIIKSGRNIKTIKFDYFIEEFGTPKERNFNEDWRISISNDDGTEGIRWREGFESQSWKSPAPDVVYSELTIEFFEPLSKNTYLPFLDMTVNGYGRASKGYPPRHPYPYIDEARFTVSEAFEMSNEANLHGQISQGRLIEDAMADKNFFDQAAANIHGDDAYTNPLYVDINPDAYRVNTEVIAQASVFANKGRSFQIVETHPEYLKIVIFHGSESAQFLGSNVRIFGGILENSLHSQV